MTRLRSRRKLCKGEASTRCLVTRESSPSIVEGMVHKKKSDQSLLSNKKLKIQWYLSCSMNYIGCDLCNLKILKIPINCKWTMGNGYHKMVSDMMCREDVVYVIGEFHLVYSWVGETKVIEGVGLGVLVPATQATVMVVFKIPSMCGQYEHQKLWFIAPNWTELNL